MKRPKLDTEPVSADRVLDASPLAGSVPATDYSQIDVLEVTPEMAAFVDSYAGDLHNRYARMKQLVFAVMGEGNFDLVCDQQRPYGCPDLQ